MLRLPRPAAEIIIGNPSIADVTVQSGNLLVVTGKSFGITNFIVLDAERSVIWDSRVLVRRDDVKVVNLQRGINRRSFNCTPQCNPQIVIGDEAAYFNATKAASEAKIGFSERGDDSGAQSNGQSSRQSRLPRKATNLPEFRATGASLRPVQQSAA